MFRLSSQFVRVSRSSLQTCLKNQRFSSNTSSSICDTTKVSVKAYYIARGIDIIKSREAFVTESKWFNKKSVTILTDLNSFQHIVLFTYGSVVFFNIPEAQQAEYLMKIKGFAVTKPVTETPKHTDDYKILINPNLEKPSAIKAEHCVIKELDSKNVDLISTVLAQTVALDYYAESVEKMLEKFMAHNMKIEQTGDFMTLAKSDLYKLVASNNAINVSVLSKLGIFEGSDAAWDNADYSYTFEMLRKDFELESRFKDLSMKLDIVKNNSMFFMEMINSQKSSKLEQIIIALIAIEIVIGTLGLLQAYQ